MLDRRLPISPPSGIFYGWIIVLVGFLANMVTTTMNPLVFSIFIDPMREDLGVTLSAMAWAISLRMFTGGLVAPLMGRIIDSHGARWLGFFCGLLAGSLLIALYWADNIWMIYILFAVSGLSGFGNFGGQLLTVVPVANWFIAKRGRTMSIAAVGGGLGTGISAPLALFLINTYGWRLTWVIFGVIIWVVILPSYGLLMRRRPEDFGLYPDGTAGVDVHESQSGVSQDATKDWSLGQALRNGAFWYILVFLSMYNFSTSGVLFLRVPFWNDLGISPQAVALGVSMDPFTVIFAMLFFGFLAERYPVRFMAVMGGFWRALSMIPLVMSGSLVWHVFFHNIVWGIGSGAFGATQNLIFPTYYGRRAQAAIRGISMPVMIVAGASAPPLCAFLVDSGLGIGAVWQITLGMMFVAGIGFYWIRPPVAPNK